MGISEQEVTKTPSRPGKRPGERNIMKKKWFITYRYNYGAGVSACCSKIFTGTEDDLQKYISNFDERCDNFHWHEITKAR